MDMGLTSSSSFSQTTSIHQQQMHLSTCAFHLVAFECCAGAAFLSTFLDGLSRRALECHGGVQHCRRRYHQHGR